MKTVTIHQPQYFPWLGLLDKISNGDSYIILDNVQLADRGFQHRNIFLRNDAQTPYLTIPISKKHYRSKHIKDIKISDTNFTEKHIAFFSNNYRKHPYFKEVMGKIEIINQKKYDFLIDAIVDSMIILFDIFGIDTNILYASDLLPETSAKKEELIIELVKATEANIYLSGTGAEAYQEEAHFKDQNITLQYHSFKHPVYPQINSGDTFIDGLSALDMAFNIGLDKCKNVFDSE